MYTAIITKKEIIEQQEWILLTVELQSDQPVIVEKKKDKTGKEVPEYVMAENGEPKLDKKGKPKLAKVEKPKLPTKTIFFKFKLDTTWEAMKDEIKKRIDAIELHESQEIPMNTPIDFSKK